MKICLLGAKTFHADGRTDGHDEPNSRFSQFREKRPKTRLCGSKYTQLLFQNFSINHLSPAV